MSPLITQQHIDSYKADGAVLIKGLFADHVEDIAAGIAMNMDSPGPYAAENLRPGESGRFFDDYCNWQRIPPFEKVIRESEVAAVAADLMSSQTVQLFHDHVLVKEPGTAKPTPWHQDSPYYFVGGRQTVSFWCPVDPVDDATLRCVAGSHLWDRPVLVSRPCWLCWRVWTCLRQVTWNLTDIIWAALMRTGAPDYEPKASGLYSSHSTWCRH